MEETPNVNREQAEKEVTAWLDFKKVPGSKRKSNQSFIENMTEAIMDGTLIVEDDKTLVHTLKFPIDGKTPVKQLKYKPRLRVENIMPRLQGLKPGDADGRLLAYVAALTEQNSGIIEKLDSEDYSLGQAIAVFFT